MGQILSPGRKSRTRHIEYLRHFICRWDGHSVFCLCLMHAVISM